MDFHSLTGMQQENGNFGDLCSLMIPFMLGVTHNGYAFLVVFAQVSIMTVFHVVGLLMGLAVPFPARKLD